MALSLDEALGVAALDESDKSIHIDLATRQVVIPESEKLFGVESDDAVEVKHIVIDGRYTDAGKDISELSWRVNFRNANGDKNVFPVTKVTAGDDSVEFDWVIRRSVVAYKGSIDFVVCAFGKDSDGKLTPEWNSTLGHGDVLEGLEVDAEDIGGDEILDELKSLQVDMKALSDSAAKSASDALDSKNAAAQIETEVGTLGDEKKKAITDESVKQQKAIQKKGSDTLASIPEDYQQLTTDVGQLKEDLAKKLNRTYEAIDAGKHLIVGADGVVVPTYSSGGASDVEIAGGWAELQAIANAGNAARYFAAGDLVANTWKDTAANKTYDSPLRINHFSDETLENNSIIHGMWLQAKWASPFGVQFSQYQAIQVFDDGLAAGTYYYTFGDTNGNKGIMTKGTSFNFTLTKDIPAGGKIAGLRGYWDNDAPYTNLKMYVYDADGLTILETVSIAKGEDGTNLGTLTNLGSDTLNSLHRICCGDNCWSRSAIRQFLNSDKPKGQWWTAQSKWDTAPNELNSKDGYLCGVDPDLLAAIKPVKVQTYRNTLCYDDKAKGNTPDITYDKVTLSSIEQMFITPQQAGEGEAQEYYVHLNGTGTKYAQWMTYPELRHYGVDNHNAAQGVRLQSAYRSSGYNTWGVYSSGYVGSSYAFGSWRFAPLVFIG